MPASIAWIGPDSSANYNTDYDVGDTVTVDATEAKYTGIQIDFSSTIDGTFRLNGGGRQLNFSNEAAITAGDSFTMFWDFSHQLGSGNGQRSAIQFNAGSSVDMNVDVKMYGGGDTLQNYWGTSSDPTAQHTNGGILEFQDIFISDPTDYPTAPATGHRSYGGGPTSAVYTGFKDADTATIAGGQSFPGVTDYDGTDPIDGDANFRFHIVGPQRNATDFKFSGWHITVNALEDIAAGSNFLYTFEGVIAGPAVPVP